MSPLAAGEDVAKCEVCGCKSGLEEHLAGCVHAPPCMTKEQLEGDIWVMSNRQPWVHGICNGILSCKTRKASVVLPPVGATVFLHCSKLMWRGWQNLKWVKEAGLKQKDMAMGGVVGFATVADRGPSVLVVPSGERRFFVVDGPNRNEWDCCGPNAIRLKNVVRTYFVPCPGAQTPTRRLPPAIAEFVEAQRRKNGMPPQGVTGGST